MAIAAAGAATAGVVALWGRIKDRPSKTNDSAGESTQAGQSDVPTQAPSS